MTTKTLELQADGLLLCPECGGGCVHHHAVDVFDRGEDEPNVVRSTVSGSNMAAAMLPNEDSGNPSRRRDGLVVHFLCEQCHLPYAMTIAQHKGSTYVVWRHEPELERRPPARPSLALVGAEWPMSPTEDQCPF